MAIFDTKTSVFTITSSTASTENISSYITSIDGLPGRRELTDVTTFGSAGHRWNPSLENAEFTIDVLYSEDATVGTDTIFGPMRTSTTTRVFYYYPGISTGAYYTGNCWLDDYPIVGKVGDSVRARVHCKVDNGITRGP
jgi:hypothetical protein